MGASTIRKVEDVLGLLEGAYGKKRRPPAMPLLDHVLMATLADHGARTRTRAAHKELTDKFVDWNEVRVSSSSEVAEVLEPLLGEHALPAANAVRAVLSALFETLHELSLEHMLTKTAEECLVAFGKLPMLNAESREVILLHALSHSTAPTASNALRVVKRIGVFGPNVSGERCRVELGEILGQADLLSLNVLLFHHAETVCVAKGYDCTRCALVKRCDRGKERKAQVAAVAAAKASRPATRSGASSRPAAPRGGASRSSSRSGRTAAAKKKGGAAARKPRRAR